MSQTRKLLSSHLALVLAPLALAGCDRNAVYSVVVGFDDDCPTVEEVNDQYLPSGPECGGGSYLRAREFLGRSDGANWYWYYDTGDTGGDPQWATCDYSAVHRSTIRGQNCAIGRPLVEAGAPRVAAVRLAKGPAAPGPWARGGAPALDGLTADQRQQLAAFWLRSALFEHASIASFNQRPPAEQVV